MVLLGLIDRVGDFTVGDLPFPLGDRSPKVLKDRFGGQSGKDSQVSDSQNGSMATAAARDRNVSPGFVITSDYCHGVTPKPTGISFANKP